MILVFMAVDKVEHLLKLAFMYCLSTLKISYLVIAACIADENHNIRVTCRGLACSVDHIFHGRSTDEFFFFAASCLIS